jgi:uncharacterized protein
MRHVSSASAAVLIVPGLRGDVPDHWQTLLANKYSHYRTVPPIGGDDINLDWRVRAIEAAASGFTEPFVVVAHSAGTIMTVHWAHRTRLAVQGALLAAPPDLEMPMPGGYPTVAELRSAGWLPVPRTPLPFPSIVAASRNDPLASFERAADLAKAWNSKLLDLGEVGHLNPASGFGDWPQAEALIEELAVVA